MLARTSWDATAAAMDELIEAAGEAAPERAGRDRSRRSARRTSARPRRARRWS